MFSDHRHLGPSEDQNKSHDHLEPQQLMVDLAECLPNARVIDGVLSNEANVIRLMTQGLGQRVSLSITSFPSVIIGMNDEIGPFWTRIPLRLSLV